MKLGSCLEAKASPKSLRPHLSKKAFHLFLSKQDNRLEAPLLSYLDSTILKYPIIHQSPSMSKYARSLQILALSLAKLGAYTLKLVIDCESHLICIPKTLLDGRF